MFPSLTPLIIDTMTAYAGWVEEGLLIGPKSLPTPNKHNRSSCSVSDHIPSSSEAYTAQMGGTGPMDPQVYFSRITAEWASATELSLQDNLQVNDLHKRTFYLLNLVFMLTVC